MKKTKNKMFKVTIIVSGEVEVEIKATSETDARDKAGNLDLYLSRDCWTSKDLVDVTESMIYDVDEVSKVGSDGS
jgi:hypothetical protein